MKSTKKNGMFHLNTGFDATFFFSNKQRINTKNLFTSINFKNIQTVFQEIFKNYLISLEIWLRISDLMICLYFIFKSGMLIFQLPLFGPPLLADFFLQKFNCILHLQLVAFLAEHKCFLWLNRNLALCTIRSLGLALESIGLIAILDQLVWQDQGFLYINQSLLHSKQYSQP